MTAATSFQDPNAVHVHYELGTPLDRMEPTTPFQTGTNILSLLDKLAAGAQRTKSPNRVGWQLLENDGGAVTLQPRTEIDLAKQAAVDLVEGFAAAERDVPLHPAWDQVTAGIARKVATKLGTDRRHGLRLVVGGGGLEAELSANVTSLAAEHLEEATRATTTSYGEVTGVLGGVSAKPRRRASLWSDLDERRIEVGFPAELEDEVRQAWARPHVRATGVLHENVVGQILRIEIDSITVVQAGGPSWFDVREGAYPSITSGLSPADYLALIRGEE